MELPNSHNRETKIILKESDNNNNILAEKKLIEQRETRLKKRFVYELSVLENNKVVTDFNYKISNDTVICYFMSSNDKKTQIKIIYPDDYPFVPPKVYFIGNIPQHQYVFDNGYLSLDILHEDWSPTITLYNVIVEVNCIICNS